MDTSDARTELFQQMEEELWQYNRALDAGRNPPEPQYDPRLFREFRIWQQEKISRLAREAWDRPDT